MKEKNKYYTPEIEEFHVGFEYENNNRNPWEKKVFSFNDSMINIHGLLYIDSLIQNNNVRVKYLDKEDIESLGWKHSWFENGYSSYEIEKFLLQTQSNSRYIEVYNNKILDKFKSVLFRGIIKNKSELVKVMKQLGIE